MNFTFFLCIIIKICLFFFLSSENLFASCDPDEILSISIKDSAVLKGERIIEFQIRLKAAYINSLNQIPVGWIYYISNSRNEDPPWTTTLNASAGIGNAAVHSHFFKNFLTIKKFCGTFYDEIGFDIEIKLFTTTDFEKIHERIFKRDKITIQLKSNFDRSP
jgi:hypothetical protein